MKISDWLDEKEAENVDVSIIFSNTVAIYVIMC